MLGSEVSQVVSAVKLFIYALRPARNFNDGE